MFFWCAGIAAALSSGLASRQRLGDVLPVAVAAEHLDGAVGDDLADVRGEQLGGVGVGRLQRGDRVGSVSHETARRLVFDVRLGDR